MSVTPQSAPARDELIPGCPGAPSPLFDHEKLDVYQLELQFIAWTTDLLEEVSRKTVGRTREVYDQLDRASLSALLNTAEGNGKRQRQVRARFFDDARGTATEYTSRLLKKSFSSKKSCKNPNDFEGHFFKTCLFQHPASCLDALVVKRAAALERILEGKKLLIRIVSLLCQVVDRYDAPGPADEFSKK